MRMRLGVIKKARIIMKKGCRRLLIIKALLIIRGNRNLGLLRKMIKEEIWAL